MVGSGLVNEIRGRDFGISLEQVTHTRAVQIWDARGRKGKGKGLWCLIGVGDAYSRGPIWDAMGNWGDNVLCWEGVQWCKPNVGTIGDLT